MHQIKRITLINPPYNYQKESLPQVIRTPPLGLAYIAAILEKNNYAVEIIDGNAECLTVEEIVSRVAGFNADMVGLTATTPTIDIAHGIAKKIKNLNGNTVTVIGGVHATVLPKETLNEFSCFDYLVRNEGELTLLELLECLNNNLALNLVKGVVYKKDNVININAPRAFIEDLDCLCFPARNLLKTKLYSGLESNITTSLVTSRGCPGQCIYCAVNIVGGGKCRRRSVFNVIEEMEQCFYDNRINHITFVDDTFTFDRRWTEEFCLELSRKKIHRRIKWSCLTRVDKVDLSLLKLMKSAGCVRISFGIESGAQERLDFLKKGITVAETKKAFRMTREIGLLTMGFIILNIPGETRQHILETKRLVLEVDPDFLQISFGIPYMGTELFNICYRENLINNNEKRSDYILSNCRIIKNKDISESEFKRLMLDIARSFYLRPCYMLRTFLYIVLHPSSIKNMLKASMNIVIRLRNIFVYQRRLNYAQVFVKSHGN